MRMTSPLCVGCWLSDAAGIGPDSSVEAGDVYSIATYHAFLMLVGENISPVTQLEFWFVMVFMVSGAVMTAVVFGDSTAQHSTAQHSTAQQSTAQQSRAQHSRAQHSRAQTQAGKLW